MTYSSLLSNIIDNWIIIFPDEEIRYKSDSRILDKLKHEKLNIIYPSYAFKETKVWKVYDESYYKIGFIKLVTLDELLQSCTVPDGIKMKIIFRMQEL